MVANGIISVNGSNSSKSSKKKTNLLLPGNIFCNTVAEIGADMTSVNPPRIGKTSDEVPIMSINKHIESFPKSGSGRRIESALINGVSLLSLLNLERIASLKEESWGAKKEASIENATAAKS
mmetsp:Transcript_5945/g.6667  ORF Transcript_5945/g.6667 Transcript_5945/m.6667 type:complete len:122 (-) Transcript_5945:507-872(-)